MIEDLDTPDSQNILFASPTLSRRIIHRLQRGEHIDPFLSAEFRFLEQEFTAWENFFRFLGYALVRCDVAGESFFHLRPDSGQVRADRLGRGATFLGIFLAWHFLSQGIDGQDHVRGEDLADRVLGNFDFNLLVPVFLPIRGRGRKRTETEQNREKMLKAIRSALNELARYRFIELRPSLRADWKELRVFRLPGLQRFLEAGRAALLQQGNETRDPMEAVNSLWNSLAYDDAEPENNSHNEEDA